MSLLRVLLLLTIIPAFGLHLPLAIMSMLFAVLGFVAGGTVPLIMSQLKISFGVGGFATGVGLNAAIGNLAAAAAQPILGAILERDFLGVSESGVRLYASSGYGRVLLLLTLLSCVSIIGTVLSVDRRPR